MKLVRLVSFIIITPPSLVDRGRASFHLIPRSYHQVALAPPQSDLTTQYPCCLYLRIHTPENCFSMFRSRTLTPLSTLPWLRLTSACTCLRQTYLFPPSDQAYDLPLTSSLGFLRAQALVHVA